MNQKDKLQKEQTSFELRSPTSLTNTSYGSGRLRVKNSVAEETDKTPQKDDTTSTEPKNQLRFYDARVLAGFWILGLCNNFGYVVMLSAAYDILQPAKPVEGCKENGTLSSPHHLICHAAGTGNILLADVLPALIGKIVGSFLLHRESYNVRYLVVIICSYLSFTLVGVGGSQIKWLSYLGIALGSFGSGLGEFTALSFTSHYAPRYTITTWSSGTGAAGLLGAFAYSGLTQLGLSPKHTLLGMLAVPTLQAFGYFWVIVKPPNIQSGWSLCSYNTGGQYDVLGEDDSLNSSSNNHTFLQSVMLIKPLLKFMIPLMAVYAAEYFINQALFELLYFTSACSWMSIESQYRWFQAIYQFGVFISRSSLLCFKFKYLWSLPILQMVNVAILLCQVLFHYIPDQSYGIWIVFALILWEGLFGGLAYVHTFYQISQQIPAENKEFSMGLTTISDSIGIVTVAFVSILAHNQICLLGISW